MHAFRNGARLHALVNLYSLFGGIANYPAVGAFADMAVDFSPQISVRLLVEVIA